MRIRHSLTAVCSFGAMALSVLSGCSGSSGESDGEVNGNPDGGLVFADGAFGGDSTVNGDGGKGPNGNGDGGGSGGADARISPDAACANETHSAVTSPPNLLLLFDRSGSMRDNKPDDVNTRWTLATRAMTKLLDQSRDTLKVGIRFFPYPNDNNCDTNYSTPQVAVAPLSTTRIPIECWLGTKSGAACNGAQNVGFDDGTPMAVAVKGAINHMKTQFNGSGPRAVVLVTDGDPNGCGSIDEVITNAGVGPSGGQKVTVYVVGIGDAELRNLSRVAFAGGGKRTANCVPSTSDLTKICHYQIGATNYETELVKALDDISTKLLSCTFPTPPARSGDAGVDLNFANVSLTTGGATSLLPRDASHANGWDYTDNGTTITVFGAKCDAIKADPTASVQILLACKGATNPPQTDAGNPPADAGQCPGVGSDCTNTGECCTGLACKPNANGTFACQVDVR